MIVFYYNSNEHGNFSVTVWWTEDTYSETEGVIDSSRSHG
jgi:hypothetical protein